MDSKYTVGFDIYDNKPLTKGVFVIWDKKINAPHKIIETRFVKLWLLWFKLKGFKVLKEENNFSESKNNVSSH